MKKNTAKLLLDAGMAVLLILMYSKSVISMEFHEIGGLTLCGLFLIHKGLNFRWIGQVSKRLFDKTLPLKTKLGCAVNALLFLSVAGIALSGIFISKTVFNVVSSNRGDWTTLHYFAAALALLLTGVHIGLHWPLIRSVTSKKLRLPALAAKPLGILCAAAILAYGGYSLVTNGVASWLARPFSEQSFAGEHALGEGQQLGKLQGEGAGLGNGAGRSGDGNGQHLYGKGGETAFSFSRLMSVIASYGSVLGFFVIVTALLASLFKLKPRLPAEIC